MFANVFSYNPITSSWKEFSKTSIYTATADKFNSSVILTRPKVTFAAIRSENRIFIPICGGNCVYFSLFQTVISELGESIFDN